MTDTHTASCDKRLAAVCGLYCPSCTLYIATQEDPERLKKLATLFKLSEEDVKCEGCRSEKRGPYCKICKMSTCAAEKGVDFCGACAEYPCDDLKVFQAAMPHRNELWSAQERISEVGYARWMEEARAAYSCSQCGTVNSAYDLACRQCGNTPSCAYVARNQQTIREHMDKRL